MVLTLHPLLQIDRSLLVHLRVGVDVLGRRHSLAMVIYFGRDLLRTKCGANEVLLCKTLVFSQLVSAGERFSAYWRVYKLHFVRLAHHIMMMLLDCFRQLFVFDGQALSRLVRYAAILWSYGADFCLRVIQATRHLVFIVHMSH